VNPLRTLLACSLILASTAAFAADSSSSTAPAQPAPSNAENLSRLERIIIPKLEFRETTIREAIDFLKKKSTELDADAPPGERGLNIVLKLDAPGSGPSAIPGIAAAPGRGQSTPEAAPPALGNPAEARITLSLKNISMLEALKYVTTLANLKLKVESNYVSIVPLHEPTESLITREWKIPPDLIPRTPLTGSGPGIADREIAKNWLIVNGVTFDGAATAIYLEKRSRLIVYNTQDQLDLVDTIIHSGQDVGPASVEIECHFVEIQGNDLKEWNFDGLLRQFNSPATQNVFISGGDVGRSVQVITPHDPVIRGTNASNFKITSGPIEVLTFPQANVTATSCVFTDPQIQLIFRSLQQKKGVKFLSLPTMTVKSGQPMVVEVIRAFHDLLEDPLPQIPAASSSLAPGQFPVVMPPRSWGDNRELDLTLEVKPVVGPDGYTIDLNLSHQAREFEGDLGQGSPVVVTTPNPTTGAAMQKILTPCLHPVPIFSTRKETQSISVYDGSTVVLAGLLRKGVPEEGKHEDILLGSVPFLQPPFRSTPGHPVQVRFLVFVTARLVNAGSGPVGADEETEPVIENKPTAPSEVLPLMPK